MRPVAFMASVGVAEPYGGPGGRSEVPFGNENQPAGMRTAFFLTSISTCQIIIVRDVVGEGSSSEVTAATKITFRLKRP